MTFYLIKVKIKCLKSQRNASINLRIINNVQFELQVHSDSESSEAANGQEDDALHSWGHMDYGGHNVSA